ncbi:MAG: BtpA/SgcQ family protein [Planctomycetota bacterium]|jgi:membrane complex biogenesis BtpA family protein|nr:BtpA/SgcQ family protein [Planctomycetota bacterium]
MLALPFQRPFLIGVVHLLPTPGSPGYAPSSGSWLARAREDADALVAGGCHGLIVENFGDTPFFPDHVPAETIASLALGLSTVIEGAQGIPVGVNVLRNDARAALGLCAATGASFLRVNVHTGAMITDQGLIEGQAAQTLRERQRLQLTTPILADVHVKHAVPVATESIADAARDAVHRGHADALVVSGSATGSPADMQDLQVVREAVGPGIPILVGSGCTLDNVTQCLDWADGLIVGTALKQDGDVHRAVDVDRVRALVSAVESA